MNGCDADPHKERNLSKKLKDLSFVIVPMIAIVALVAAIELSSRRGDAEADAKSAEKPAAITVKKADAEADTKSAEKAAPMTVEQVNAALSRVIKNVTVQSVAPSPVEGLWELVVVTPQGKRIAYIDMKGRFLISGSLINLSTGTDLTRARMEDLNRVDFASIPLDDAIVMGNPKAARKVVVYDDPD